MKLGFGLMRLPCKSADNSDIDINKTMELADAFLAAGGTYFDTAYMYHGGKSEVAFRQAVVERYARDRFTVTDKLPIFQITKAEEMQAIFEEQLQRCGVDFFDYYWLHALGSESYQTAQRLNAFAFICEKKRLGLVRHVGFSFHDSPALLDRILTEHPELEYVQLQINYLDWDDPTVCARECLEVAKKHNKPVIVMEPIKGGALANVPKDAEDLLRSQDPSRSIASWAMRFAASCDQVIMVLSGMGTMEQMQDNLSYMKTFVPLNESEKKAVMQAAELIRNSIAIPCTACRYCVDGCPKHIAIPDYFAIYNNLKRYGESQRVGAMTYYQNLRVNHGAPSDCIRCAKCENHCPQHLPIRAYLTQVEKELEHHK